MNAENAAIQSDQRRTDKGKSVHITSNQDIKQQVPSGNFDLVAKSPQKSFFSSFHKRETMPPKIPVTTLRAITTEDSFVKLDYKIVRKPIKRKVSFKDKSWYDGEWDGTKKHGRGLLYYANGDMYEGEFSKGFRHGYATCKYQNGTTFNGYWVVYFEKYKLTCRFKIELVQRDKRLSFMSQVINMWDVCVLKNHRLLRVWMQL